MGNSIDKIADGFYICGVDALSDIDRLRSLGITHILNAAYLDLYRDSQLQLPNLFTVKSLECEDSELCNLSVHFEDLAEFIQQGRQAGGVVVHCAAGISRASTSACAYLMIKENLSLDAAFHKVYSVRNVVHPNEGFWRQLRDLEAALRLRGADLKPLSPDKAVDETAGPMSSASDKEDMESVGSTGCYPEDNNDFHVLLQRLDASLAFTQSFPTHFLTARVTVSEGVVPAKLREQLMDSSFPGVVWTDLRPENDTNLGIRASVVPSIDTAAFQALLKSVPGVREAVCESSTLLPSLSQ